jgi:hypothetical protein
LATSAPSVSLSPNLISSLTTVSFSLMTGTTRQLQQREQRGARVEVALAVGQVGVRQQHLRRAHAVFAQLGLVHLARPIWPTAAAACSSWSSCGRVVQPRRFMPSAMAPLDTMITSRPVACERGQLPAPLADGHLVQAAALVGDQAGADLDHDAPASRRRSLFLSCMDTQAAQ